MFHADRVNMLTNNVKALPRGKNLDHTTSEKKENVRKNRYNDIKSCEATRVKLKKIPGDESSDYINANIIKVCAIAGHVHSLTLFRHYHNVLYRATRAAKCSSLRRARWTTQ